MRIAAKRATIAGAVALLGLTLPTARAADHSSPAECGPGDTPETGIQGDVGPEGGVNCGLTAISQIGGGGNAVQGFDHCAYVRVPSPGGTAQKEEPGGVIRVFDMTDAGSPELVAEVTYAGGSETMRTRITPERKILVNGRSVFDISECDNPVLKGEIPWRIEGVFESDRPSHDIRISRDGTKVWASTGVKVADISNLEDDDTWTVRTYRCDVGRQAGNPFHQAQDALDWCEVMGEFPSPTYVHSPDVNDRDTRLYIGGQTIAAAHTEQDVLRILDTSQPGAPKILDSLDGPGHSMDWFRIVDDETGVAKEYILHANEIGAAPQSTCLPHPRPSSLGFAWEAFITEVTNDQLVRASLVELAINKPENCQAKLASGQSADVSYHMVDNPDDATFALVSFGEAGLRMFDIRDPSRPTEVAYFNHGRLSHAGVSYYDAERHLVYVPSSGGMTVLKIEPQVLAQLGLGCRPLARCRSGHGCDARSPREGCQKEVPPSMLMTAPVR